MKIAIAQINPTVGDLKGNYEKIISNLKKAKGAGVELVVFPELVLTGYPPRDLLLKKCFIERNLHFLRKVVKNSKGIAVILGFVDEVDGDLFNAVAIINNSMLIGVSHKIHLPNYDVFDEKRYFEKGREPAVFELNGLKIGANVCEDVWIENGPVTAQKELGADLIVNVSASPFHAGKGKLRESIISAQARDNRIPIIYANLVGGQDELIFDGQSYLFNKKGELLAKAKSFEEDFLVLPDFNKAAPMGYKENINEDILDALVLGTKDYFIKNKFRKAVIGLSGGIDSALTAVIAVKALGKENVLCVSMPSRFSSEGSVKDSVTLAENLGVKLEFVPIKSVFDVYLDALAEKFRGTEFNVAEENIQARIRGNILMAISNKFGHLVLATGNKSELSVGYATLYGDMSGGLSVISDVLKTKVYELCNYINERDGGIVIPKEIITKEPSAELKEDQKDSDSLPEYNVLDPILIAYINDDESKENIIKMGFDKKIVEKVTGMVDKTEYKRRQAAIGLRITPRAFGVGRRMPITNGWVED